MLSQLRLERQKTNSSNPFRIRIFFFPSKSFGFETINTFIHSDSLSSLENHTPFQTKMGKVYTRFQTRNGAKTVPDGAAHTHMAYIREYPPRAELLHFSVNRKLQKIAISLMFKAKKNQLQSQLQELLC